MRGFGGVPAFPVQIQAALVDLTTRADRWFGAIWRSVCAWHARMLCVLCFHILFLAISVVLSVGTRHHKPPLCGGRASGRRGQVAGSAAPGRAAKSPNFCYVSTFHIFIGFSAKSALRAIWNLHHPFHSKRGSVPFLAGRGGPEGEVGASSGGGRPKFEAR